MKRIFINAILAITLVYLIFFVHNNYWFADFTDKEIDAAYNKSISWVEDNQEEILRQHNPMLWWMLIEALKVENEPRLKGLVEKYQRKNQQNYSRSEWRYLIFGERTNIDSFSVLTSTLPDYNKHFIYSFSCNKELLDSKIIKSQNKINFCFKHHPISPACLTHQLMSFRFMERNGCEGVINVKNTIREVSNLIMYQLMFDVRMVDVYIQRVMMLLDSGYRSKIKDRWIKRVIDGQLDDGGWGDFQPLIAMSDNRFIGFGSKGFAVKSPQSTFHATAQGILLMTMLRKLYPEN